MKQSPIYKKAAFILFAACLASLVLPDNSRGQADSYEWMPAPDLWYNSVDGVRVGVRLMGRVPGTFSEGPHRLDAGLWVGTKFPDHPTSYYLSFTEPIPAVSSFGNEGNIRLESSYRTGFQKHGLSFNKRWQEGFEELNYKEVSLAFYAEHRFDDAYLLYPQLWQDDWLWMPSLTFNTTDTNGLGRYYMSFGSEVNVAGSYDSFIRGAISFQQHIPLSAGFAITGRFYTAMASENTAPEYLISRSLRSPRYWMRSGLSRARGTVPPAWIKAGTIQFTGGANLRGYLHQDIEAMNAGAVPFYTSLSSLNLEFHYPNPLNNAFDRIPMVGQFMDLRSYLFLDTGTSLGFTEVEEDRLLADAGPGFKFLINIPDYLGKRRGLTIRYDLPVWVSHPGEENTFKFRHVIGIGAAISL